MTEDPYEAERAAQAQALTAELEALASQDDPTSLERRYELHCALIWKVWAMGTMRGQEQAEQAVAIARRLQDPQREAAALHAWASVYLSEHVDATGSDIHPTQEESQAGQRLHEEALHIREQLLGPDHPDVADSLLQIVNQGRLWWPIEPYQAMAERAVSILERALGPEHERTIDALHRLVFFYQSPATLAKGLAIRERLLDVYLRTYGPDEHNHTFYMLRDIALTHRAMGHYAEALARLQDLVALKRYSQNLPDPSYIHDLMIEISHTLRAQGDDESAEMTLTEELARLDAELGPDHPRTRAFLEKVGMSYQLHGERDRARAIYERLIESYDRTESQGDEVTSAELTFFTMLWRQGDRVSAGNLFARLLPSFGEPVELLPILNAIGFLGDIGEDDAPEDSGITLVSLYAQLENAMEQRYGPDHPHIATLLIAWAQRLVHNWENIQTAAIPLLNRALAIHPAALASPDEELLRLIRSIDEALSGEAEYATVREIYLRAHAACMPVLGAEHPRIVDLQDRLDLLADAWPARREQGDPGDVTEAEEAEGAGEDMDDADIVIFLSPARSAAVRALRALLTRESERMVHVAPTLGAAIAAPSKILILMLTNDQMFSLTSEQITRLQNRKVIGIGYGAAKVFGALGLEINDGACAHYGAMAMPLVVEPNQLAQLPGLGDPVGIVHSDATSSVDHVGLHIPRTSLLVRVVDVLARVQFDPNYALMVRQGHHILIGLAAPPDVWTRAYADLFHAVANALHAYEPQPFARAAWETTPPGVYPFSLARGRSTTEASAYQWHLRFSKPTTLAITLTIAGSESVMLLFMGEKREHWTREDGSDGETLSITIDITEADLQAVGDRYWDLAVTNFDTEQTAACVLTIDYQE